MSITESQNTNTQNLDQLSNTELVETFLNEDKQILVAIDQAKDDIASAIEVIYKALNNGGRLFYFGAGTSGRLGILDAVECPPTFSTDPNMVQGVIAGGDPAIKQAVEGAEDDEQAGYDFVTKNLSDKDVLVGISASATTPFVAGAIKAAKAKAIANIAIANNKSLAQNISEQDSQNENSLVNILDLADHGIYLATGPEVLSGSTRLKAGTSQKMVLNILSTSVMVKLGKTYANLMVDVKASNKKLVKRATKLVMQVARCQEEQAKEALEQTHYKVKNAILFVLKGLSFEESQKLLDDYQGFLSKIL